MSGLLILRGLLFAAECFLASLLLPVLAFAVSALLRRRAALRHLIFTTMFGVLAVLPLVALLLPPRRIVEHVAAPVTLSAADLAPVAAPVAVTPLMAAPPPAVFTVENIVALLLALWLAGLCWQALRLGVGGLGLLRLRRRSVPFMVELETGCEVRLARGEHGPSTFGIFRPIVLLPGSALAWPAARLDAVLRHEAAHVARRDTLSQFIARLVCAVFWPNPLLWLAARSLRREAEIAADDAVLASGLTPSLYAAELVSLAAESRGLAPGIAMAGPPLARRVEAVLAENSSRKGVTKMDMAKTATLGLTAALLLGVARFDIAVAQDAPVAPDVAAAPKVEKNNDIQIEKNVAVKAKTEATAAAIRAQADAVTAKARAKAAAETDPVKKAQYAQDAIQVAAESARMKAQADRIGDRSLSAVERAASARALSADALAKAQSVLAQQTETLKQEGADPAKQQLSQMSLDALTRARAAMAMAMARANADRMRLAEAAPHAESSSSADAESSTTINGVTTTIRSNRSNGAPQNSNSNSDTSTNNGLTIARPQQENDFSRLNSVRRYSTTRDGFQIDVQVTPNAAEGMSNAVREVVRTAMDEASRKIAAAIADARAQAGLPPAIPSFAPPRALPAIPPIPRVPPVPPAPPAPG